MKYLNAQAAATALVLAGSGAYTSDAQEKPYTQPSATQPADTKPTDAKAAGAAPPPARSTNDFFNGKIPEALAKGKFSLNVRPRWEHANQSNLRESDAFTVRSRFGFTTAPVYGFQAMLEG